MAEQTMADIRPAAAGRTVTPYLLLVLACAFWAGNVVAGRALSMDGPDRISPAFLNALRWSVALAVLAPFALTRVQAEWKVVRSFARKLLVLGALGVAGYYLLFYNAVETVPAIEAGLLVGAMPAVIMGLALALRTESASAYRIIGLAIALFGSLATVAAHARQGFGGQHVPGDTLVLAAVLCWSVYTILLRRWKIPLSTLVLTFATAVLGFLITLVAVAGEIAAGTASLHVTGQSVLLTLYIGLFPAIGSTLCWNEAVRRLGAGTAAVFMTLIPVFAIGFAVAFLGEPVHALDLVCLACVAIGVGLVVRTPAAGIVAADRTREAGAEGS